MNVFGQFLFVKPFLFKCQVPMWCPQNQIGVHMRSQGEKYCGVSIVFLLRFCAIQKWLLNPSLIPAFELNLNCGSKQGLKISFEFRKVK